MPLRPTQHNSTLCPPLKIKKNHAVCDPVMGDEGKLYVAPEMIKAYRSRIMPLASVLVRVEGCACGGVCADERACVRVCVWVGAEVCR